MAQDLYETYQDFKGWSDVAAGGDPETYTDLLRACGKTGGLDVLEMGFGDGSFMDWARSAGHRIAGLEILDYSVTTVAARGHEAYLSWTDIPPDRRFDVIMLIDVIEHLGAAGFDVLFSLADKHLKPDGVIIARFPNGQSPFSGWYQYGDMTHDKPLTPDAISQMIQPRGYRLIRAQNPRPLPRRLGARIKYTAAYLFRDIVEVVLGYAYLGQRLPMDPNVVVVLGRQVTAKA